MQNLKTKRLILALRIVSALILLQTLFFKFTGAPESKFIFSTLGIEPWGRLIAGVSELIASVLLLVPMTQLLGALMALGIMAGAILSHFFVLGIVVQDDGGLLFVLALTVTLCSLVIIYLDRAEIPNWIFRGRKWLQQNRK